jgi:epoxide hydrolase 4
MSSPLFSPKSSHFFDNAGVRIHFRLFGSGSPLVFVHGRPDNEMTIEYQISEFVRDHTVILPTIRGYPPSDIPQQENAYDGDVMAGDLLALTEHLGFEAAIYAGGDAGGILIQKLAFKHPDRVRGLILFNTPILGQMMHLIHHDPEQQELSECSIPYIAHNLGDHFDVDNVIRHIRDDEYPSHIKLYIRESPAEGMFWFFRRNFPTPSYGRDVDTSGMHYQMPCAVIWGMKEPYFSEKMLDGLQRWFERSVRPVTLPGVGHWPWREDVVKVNR